ncbi:transporter substrate-binding domain-containing protein [Pontibaca salina]|uniref:Transporter substrate-binding domain-containing protein n=1 Tax=Pontibaca salina TaxID=2795731 RepID=A0A934M3L2_9RHOB|nr:transporter substrate-binding domain-containing protein [Pontibaca salina]MBI6629969.1 transporter substrate-binding domain-containing protein [Pontibaca salina]
MKKTILATAVLALSAGVGLAQDRTVRMGTEGAYAPYNFTNDAGEIDGFERELGDELCNRAELTCEWVKNDWDSIIPNLVSGNYDTIMAGMTVTDEREMVIDFTQDYQPPTPSPYVALSEDVDLETGVIAAQTGTLQAAFVAETPATLIEFATFDETIAALRSGEADAVLADLEYLAPVVEDSSGELLFVGDRVPLGKGIGMGVRKSDSDLRDTFDAAISSMKEDGSLNELLIKWFGENTATY